MLPSSCLDGSVTPVGPGQNPQYTGAVQRREAVGCSQGLKMSPQNNRSTVAEFSSSLWVAWLCCLHRGGSTTGCCCRLACDDERGYTRSRGLDLSDLLERFPCSADGSEESTIVTFPPATHSIPILLTLVLWHCHYLSFYHMSKQFFKYLLPSFHFCVKSRLLRTSTGQNIFIFIHTPQVFCGVLLHEVFVVLTVVLVSILRLISQSLQSGTAVETAVSSPQ